LAARAKAWQDAFNAGKADAVAALYTEGAVRLPYQAPSITGRAAIAGNIQENYDNGVTKIDLKVLESAAAGDMAWGHGTYSLMNSEGATVQQGKWMNISEKVGGVWLIHRDIWNTNAPEMSSAAQK
jgi:ketosteroid isomerase-like protein